MSKIACVFSFKASSWISCQKIVFNLHKSYQLLGTQFELLNFNFSDDSINNDELESLAKEIFKQQPDIITFLDHRPHPKKLFDYLVPLYTNQEKPKIIFHIFGDFSLHFTNWYELEKNLLKFPLEFVVASDRQKILMDKMLSSSTSTVCPFPVDSNEFYYDENLRKQQRLSWNIKEQDKVYIYTGRLTRQKRTKTLLESFAEVFHENSDAHLFLYGDPDHIGDPFVGVHEIEGEYFRYLYSYFDHLPQKLKSRIHFMGAVPNKELLSVYCGADYLIVPSVHNDEDFVMSIAEAQLTGLPAILSDWGGHASFQHENLREATRFIPVKIGTKSKLLAKNSLKKHLKDSFNEPFKQSREKLAHLATAKFGIERCSRVIMDTLISENNIFTGFSELLKKISYEENTRRDIPLFVNKKGKLRKIYKEIYSAYTR